MLVGLGPKGGQRVRVTIVSLGRQIVLLGFEELTSPSSMTTVLLWVFWKTRCCITTTVGISVITQVSSLRFRDSCSRVEIF